MWQILRPIEPILSRGRKYRRKEDRYGEERKREVPSTFKVGGNDDQVDDNGDNGRHNRLLKVKKQEGETDEEFEERRMKKRVKRQEKKLTKKQQCVWCCRTKYSWQSTIHEGT